MIRQDSVEAQTTTSPPIPLLLGSPLQTVYDTHWNPRDYLRQYYSKPEDIAASDEVAIQRFVTRYLRERGHVFERGLDLGCGPTLHHAVPLVPWVRELHLADYLYVNRAEVEKWLVGRPDAHDWDISIRLTLETEATNDVDVNAARKGEPISEAAVEARKMQMRSRITTVTACDLRQNDPLGDGMTYDLVTSFYCAECVQGTHSTWREYMRNLLHLVAPGGVFITSALCGATRYAVLGQDFPVTTIGADDLATVFVEEGFDPASLDIQVVSVPEFAAEGFDRILIACACRKE